MEKMKLGFKGFLATVTIALSLSVPAWFMAGGPAFGSYNPTRFVPAGTILPFAGTVVPSGFLLCDGTSYLRITYPTLTTVLGCSGTACAYGAADASHFNVPDLRGKFPRGTDNMGTGASGNDPNAGSRTACLTGGNTGNKVGSCEAQATAVNGLHDTGHTHNIFPTLSGVTTGPGNYIQGASGFQNYGSANTGSSSANLAGDSETRPINVNVNYILKY